jgi:hypothetical protein
MGIKTMSKIGSNKTADSDMITKVEDINKNTQTKCPS